MNMRSRSGTARCCNWPPNSTSIHRRVGQRRAIRRVQSSHLVKFVKINFLAGRSFIDDADLQAQCVDWQDSDNTTRPSQATDVTPLTRLVEEVAKGYPLPSTATDYGFAEPGRVSSGALVAVLGNHYSVPIEHVGASVTVRMHRERIVIWHDMERLAEH